MRVDHFENARRWYLRHAKHVDSLLSVTCVSIEPSDEDAPRPDLWKPGALDVVFHRVGRKR